MRLKGKLVAYGLTLAMLPLFFAAPMIAQIAVKKSGDALQDKAEKQLLSMRETQKVQLRDYLSQIKSQVITFSNDKMIIDATRMLSPAFNSALNEIVLDRQIARSDLRSFYRQEFLPRYTKNNSGRSISSENLVSMMDEHAVVFQDKYIVNNKFPLGEKHKLDDAADGSEYSSLHKKYHPHIRQFQQEFGYYDIFLVSAKTGKVVYSVFKELDFATSLLTGPYKDSGLAESFRRAAKSKDMNDVVFTDYTPYTPSYGSSASFVSSPVYDNGKMIGVLVFQMPIDRLDQVMTSHQKWSSVGMGDTGESFIVGSDHLPRSNSRNMIEDRESFLAGLTKQGVKEKVVAELRSKNSTIGVLPLKTAAVIEALAGKSALNILKDYRGVEVLAAYTPFQFGGLNWAMVSKIDTEEVFQARDQLINDMTTTIVTLVLVILAVSVVFGIYFANALTRPIVSLSKVMGEVGSNNNLSLRAKADSKDEIGDMAGAFNSMMSKFEHLITEIGYSAAQLAVATEQVSVVTKRSEDHLNNQHKETEEVVTAMTEMSATVNEVSGNAHSVAEATSSAEKEAHNSSEVVKNVETSILNLSRDVENASNVINKVESSSDEIGAVLDVIKGIAEQTNLLALNAAIEAARAGEHGRGFAVVADEVRSLAQKTQESTSEIENTIEKLQTGTRTAVSAMEVGRDQAKEVVIMANEAANSLEIITKAVSTINDMTMLIATASEEQSAVSEEINRNLHSISDLSENAANGARETTSSTDEMAELAAKLQSLVEKFTTDGSAASGS